jgi:N utilization substance protein B
MGLRRRGREIGLQILYQIEMTGDASPEALDFFCRHFHGSPKALAFARRLVSGVLDHHDEIDRFIKRSAEHWKLSRMAKVDLAILRMAAYELLFCPDIPVSVTIDEAVEISKRYGTDDSPGFINGVLDHVALAGGVKE